jgi:Predicted pyridoxal phosphate-dependent enzyme apparently involved in regulation of cell wall biogenesis
MPELSSKRDTFLSFQPPALDETEVQAVAETLRSGWLTTGPRTAELEARMREYLEAEHVLAVSSCTAALHLSLVALGVGPGDEVITTSITWPATQRDRPLRRDARLCRRAGDTLNIDPARVRELVNERTKAIVPVDLYGQPADLDPLLELGLPLVEDAAHAAESVYRGRKIGSVADVTCFSLYATKNIAAGEGGLIATNRADLPQRSTTLRVMRRGHGSLYDIAVPGYKANLSDVLSSIALVQLDKVERHAEIRRRHVALYDEGLAGLDGITTVARDPRDVHANHLYVVRVSFADRDEVQRALADENIGTSIHFLPVHLLSAYRDRLAPEQPPLPVAERAGREVLSLPLSPAHTDDDVRDAIAALRRVHERLS